MSINLTKGSNLNLMKADPKLAKLFIGCGWEKLSDPIDVDVSCLARSQGKAITSHWIFFNQLKSEDNTIRHSGDNRSGDADGDDEVIEVDILELEKFQPPVDELSIIITIDKAKERKQNFGMMKDAYVRIANRETKLELCSYDLDASFNNCISVQVGSLVKIAPGIWEFKAVGMGYTDKNFIDIANAYGVS